MSLKKSAAPRSKQALKRHSLYFLAAISKTIDPIFMPFFFAYGMSRETVDEEKGRIPRQKLVRKALLDVGMGFSLGLIYAISVFLPVANLFIWRHREGGTYAREICMECTISGMFIRAARQHCHAPSNYEVNEVKTSPPSAPVAKKTTPFI